MITTEYNHEINKIELTPSSKKLTLGKDYYSQEENDWPLVYTRNHHTVKGKRYVYKISLFGNCKFRAKSPHFSA